MPGTSISFRFLFWLQKTEKAWGILLFKTTLFLQSTAIFTFEMNIAWKLSIFLSHSLCWWSIVWAIFISKLELKSGLQIGELKFLSGDHQLIVAFASTARISIFLVLEIDRKRLPDVDLDFEKQSIDSGRPTTIKTDEIRSIQWWVGSCSSFEQFF